MNQLASLRMVHCPFTSWFQWPLLSFLGIMHTIFQIRLLWLGALTTLVYSALHCDLSPTSTRGGGVGFYAPTGVHPTSIVSSFIASCFCTSATSHLQESLKPSIRLHAIEYETAMDPLSIASVSGSIALVCIRLSKYLHTFIDQTKEIDEEVQSFATEVVTDIPHQIPPRTKSRFYRISPPHYYGS